MSRGNFQGTCPCGQVVGRCVDIKADADDDEDEAVPAPAEEEEE